ncbi:MAG: MFS transporter [Polyangiaceae bacterium]|nr:MFS transporter [Polyangiaceae bacterium]
MTTAHGPHDANPHGQTVSWGLLGTVSFGALLSSMTASVINVALPDIARDFQVDPSAAAWVILAFLLTVTVLLLVAGRIGDMAGHGRMYMAGSAVFGLASVGCAVASSVGWLVGWRVVQGAGASLVMATAPALLTRAVPSSRRGFALGFLSTSVYVGLTVGPPVGGELMRVLGWRSVFYAMFAGSVLILIASFRALPRAKPERASPRFDFAGAAVIAVGTLAFLLASTRGPAWGWAHPATLTTAAVPAALLPVLIWIESRQDAPMLDLALFRSVVFSASCIAAVLNYITLFIAIYLLPFALRDGQHMEPSAVGRVLAAQAGGMALFAWASGWLSDHVGARWLAAGGMLVVSIAVVALALDWPTSGVATPAAYMFVCGAGTGVFISPNSSALMGAAPRDRQGIAGGMMGLSRTLGMTLGVAIASGLFGTVFPEGRAAQWSSEADAVVRLGLLVAGAVALLAGIVSLAGHDSVRRRAAR